MSALACSSKRTLVLLLMSTACTSTQTGATRDATPSRVSNLRAQNELRIAPPMGSTESTKKYNKDRIEQLLSGSGGDEHDASEIKLPASVMGLKPGDVTGDSAILAREQSRLQRTDAEVASVSGYGEFEKKLGEVDRVLDVSEEAHRPLTPSFTAQTQKIRELFREKRFEEALVEANDLIIYYPRSSILWTMKGTLHLRLSQNELSLAAYERAFDIEPSQRLLAQIEELRRLRAERESLRKQKSSTTSTHGEKPSFPIFAPNAGPVVQKLEDTSNSNPAPIPTPIPLSSEMEVMPAPFLPTKSVPTPLPTQPLMESENAQDEQPTAIPTSSQEIGKSNDSLMQDEPNRSTHDSKKLKIDLPMEEQK